jgi:hypothetical protein
MTMVCGTGDWTGPKPGDPDNYSILSAAPIFGGILVSWTYPTTNPYAVAHVLLYRGTAGSFATAAEIAVVSGNTYKDSLNPDVYTQYYYWIKIVSVNGTVGDVIGPASTVIGPIGDSTVEVLTGRIDSGVLAQSLRSEIANIIVVGQNLVGEIRDRIRDNAALAAAIDAVRSGAEESMTFLQHEVTQRKTSDSAMVAIIDTMAAAVDDNLAAIFEESQVRADADSAQSIKTTILFSESADNAAAISLEAMTRTDADSAMASNIITLFSQSGANAAAILDEQTVRADAFSSLSSSLTTAQSAMNSAIASVQTNLQTTINTVNGRVTSIGALYTAKVSVNGLIGGFGIYNDGSSVDAGFDVDTFWIGRTGPDKVKPFIIDNGTVYINKARIRNADIDTLKIAGNAVTVPASGSTSCSLYMPEPGNVYVTANIWVYETSGSDGGAVNSSCSVQINASTGGADGYCIQHSARARHMTMTTAATFPVPAGFSSFSMQLNQISGNYVTQGATMMAIGTMR